MPDDRYPAAPVGSALTDDALRSAIAAAPDGIVVVDEAGTIVFVNPMVEQLFEYERDELATYVPRVVHVDARNRVIDEVSARLDAELTLTEPA